jgi:hypothetical protein
MSLRLAFPLKAWLLLGTARWMFTMKYGDRIVVVVAVLGRVGIETDGLLRLDGHERAIRRAMIAY